MTSISPNHDIHPAAINVLNAYGTNEARMPFGWWRVVENEKIYLEASYTDNLKHYEKILIALKLEIVTAEPQFGLRRKDRTAENHTLVYRGEFINSNAYHARYFRHGRWVQYLQSMSQAIEKRFETVNLLTEQTVDDADLFPDLDDIGY